MNRETKTFLDIFFRYAIIVFSALSNLFIFYFLFTSITIYSVYFFFELFFPVYLSGNYIHFNSEFFISIIPACVAGAAYYLLFALSLSVPNLKILKRIKIILTLFLTFFVFNFLRIFFMGLSYFYGFPYSDFIHQFLWYFGSIFLTVGIWFFTVYFFKIKGIPFYSDFKFLYKKSLFNKKNRK